MYHAVGTFTEDPNMLCTTPERFEAQMYYLKRHNLRGVSMRELRRAMSTSTAGNLVGLTFDDGYEDFLYTAAPILERFGFSATVFVVVGMLGTENDWQHAYAPKPRMRLLEADELREVAARGMEVGSHGLTHAKLLSAEPALLSQEVESSRHRLSEVLDDAVEGFCFPYGSLDGAAVQAVRRAGYAYACSWRTRVEQSAYDWPRIPVSEKDNAFRFAVKFKAYAQYTRITRNFG